MIMNPMIASVKVNKDYSVALPRKIYESLGLMPGDEVQFVGMPSRGRKMSKKGMSLLKKIRSTSKRAPMRLIEKIIQEVRSKQAAR